MNKYSIEINPTLVRLAMGIPVAGVGGALGYYTAPKEHRLEGMARGAGIGYMTGTGLGVGAELGSHAATEDRTPAMFAGSLAGGAMGLGVGKMMQGTPQWEQRRKFREELLAVLHEESNKIKSDLSTRYGSTPSAIQKISEDQSLSQFADANPELTAVPAGAAAGVGMTSRKSGLNSKIRNALLGGGTAASAVGAGVLGKKVTGDTGAALVSGAGGGVAGFILLKKLLDSMSEKKSAAGPILQNLLAAKQLSDVRDYKGKHQRLRSLIEKYPDDFFVDSMQGDIVGVTHRPTGFRMHAPIRVLPSSLRGRVDANEFSD